MRKETEARLICSTVFVYKNEKKLYDECNFTLI